VYKDEKILRIIHGRGLSQDIEISSCKELEGIAYSSGGHFF